MSCPAVIPPDRKERKRERRRREILDAAEHLFFARYYDDVSMDDIATKLDLSKATLYLYFRDKEAIFYAVVHRGLIILEEMVREAVRDGKNGIDRLAILGFTYRRYAQEYPHYNRLFTYFQSGRFDTGKMNGNDDVQEIRRIMDRLWIETMDGIRMGIDDKTIRSDIDPEVLAVLLTVFSKGVNTLDSQLKKMLTILGIDQQRFFSAYIDLMYNMMENPGNKVERRKTGES